MAAPRLSVQLYSVRQPLDDDLDGTLARLAALGFDAVEPFNVLDGALGPALLRHGLEAPSGQGAGDQVSLRSWKRSRTQRPIRR